MNVQKLLSVLVSMCLLSSVTAPLMADAADKKSKAEKQAEKEAKAEAKNIERYEKVKDFSINKYKTDPDFRDDVDARYEELMREHSNTAFKRNLSRRSHLVSVDEDTWRQHTGLYDNLLVQDHINRIGQRLVPLDSEKSYAFKVIADPIPSAETLATGTVYVSTGLISMLDSEAQLAYVLAHEMAHVKLDHWKERAMMEFGQQEYNEAQEKKVARIGMIAGIAGAAVGGAVGRSGSAVAGGAGLGLLGGFILGSLLNRSVYVAWDKVQEDQADELAFKAVLDSSYDVREVPKLYLAMERIAVKDSRVQLGFLGSKRRVQQRLTKAKDLIENAFKAELELKAKNGFVSSSAEHRNLIAELKRDNGILAYYHDMFDMARSNLSDAIAIRSNDPAAHYFYAKTMKLVARTEDEMRAARDSFYQATRSDSRKQNYGAHLHLGLMMAREKGMDPKQVAASFDTYVSDYVRWNIESNLMRTYPPNLDSIYEYISLYGGDPNWRPKVPEVADLAQYYKLAESLPEPPPAVRNATLPPASSDQAPSQEPAADSIKKVVEKVPGGAAGAAVVRKAQQVKKK